MAKNPKKPIRKKLRGGSIIEIDPQILKWREKRKELGLYKPARKPKKLNIPEEVIDLDVRDPWGIFK